MGDNKRIREEQLFSRRSLKASTGATGWPAAPLSSALDQRNPQFLLLHTTILSQKNTDGNILETKRAIRDPLVSKQPNFEKCKKNAKKRTQARIFVSFWRYPIIVRCGSHSLSAQRAQSTKSRAKRTVNKKSEPRGPLDFWNIPP